MGKKKAQGPPEPDAGLFEGLIHEFEGFPGVGRRSAERMAWHVLEMASADAARLARALMEVKNRLRPCETCGNLAEGRLCEICANPRREAGWLCIVEWPRDLMAMEKTGHFRGYYHVLLGRLSPLAGVEVEDLNLKRLWPRLEQGVIKEVLLATSPSLEGDATAAYLAGRIKELAPTATVTRLARGLPEGSEMSFAQAGTLREALRRRTRHE